MSEHPELLSRLLPLLLFDGSAGTSGLEVMLDLPPFKIPLSCLGPLDT